MSLWWRLYCHLLVWHALDIPNFSLNAVSVSGNVFETRGGKNHFKDICEHVDKLGENAHINETPYHIFTATLNKSRPTSSYVSF